MAADHGAEVAGIDASGELIDVAAGRTPEGDFRVGDLEVLPWDTDSFDLVTDFSSFQFADDKVRALSEAGRGVTAGTTKAGTLAMSESFEPTQLLDSMTRFGITWRIESSRP